ncbi:rod shape-determining protein RodA [Hyphomonas hirschiana VP5]|nr:MULTISPECIES: rod shape-determining protein RodA [Hyphomonas]KCZ93699.1 rod shape-determining protein RodA [Hyphomonas hirschiana VP5]
MSRDGFTGFTRGEARVRTASSSLQFAELGPFSKLARMPWGIIFLIVGVGLVGVAMLFSVGWDPVAQAPSASEAGLWREQLTRLGIGFVIMIGLALLPLGIWSRLSWLAYLGVVVLLVLVDFFGIMGGGAARWLKIGPLIIQPSEPAKLAVTLAVASYYQRMMPLNGRSLPFWVHLGALVIILIPAALVFKQPNLSTALALTASGVFIVFFAGIGYRYVIGALVAGVAAIPAIYTFVLEPYQRERVDTLIAGITGQTTNGLGESYQIEQAKIAIGAGGFNGRGYLQGIQSQQEYVPEQHTDFILTVIAEEFGFIGSVGLLTVFGFLFVWSFRVAARNRSWFGRLATIGATSTIGFFTIFNSGMVLGLLPVLGMPLPLISYGGTALITVMACFGLILSAHLHRDEKLTTHRVI